MKYVPYCSAPPTELLCGPAGEPILPVSSVDELQQLRRIATVHNCELVRIESPIPKIAKIEAFSQRGSVVGLGAEAFDAAQLYAHLSNRSATLLTDESMIKNQRIDVILCIAEKLTNRFLLDLSELHARANYVPGLIIAPNRELLARAAKRAAAGWYCRGASGGTREFFFPLIAFEHISRSGGEFWGGKLPLRDRREFLKKAAAFKIISSHSFAIDMSMGHNLYLCPFDTTQHSDLANTPLCLETDYCTRHGNLPTREDLWKNGWAVSPENLSGQLVLLLGCSILRVANPIMSPNYSLAPAISARASLGACITSWRIETASEDGREFYPLIESLSEGHPVGSAVLNHNRSPIAAQNGSNLIVLGDPEYFISSRHYAEKLPTTNLKGRDTASYKDAIAVKLAIIAAARNNYRSTIMSTEDSEILASFFERWDQSPDGKSNINTLNHAFVIALANCVIPTPLLVQPFLYDVRGVLKAACPNCGDPARFFPGRMYVESTQWKAMICDCCGTTELSPENNRMVSFGEIHRGKLVLCQKLPQARATIRITSSTFGAVKERQDHVGNVILDWPIKNGELVNEVMLPSPLPSGPLICTVVAAWRDDFGIWRTEMRATN